MHLRLCSSYSAAVSAVGSVSGQGTRSTSACGLTSSWPRRTRSTCSGYTFDNVCSMSTRTCSFRTAGLASSTHSVPSSSPLLSSTGSSTHHPLICVASARNMSGSSFSPLSSWRLAHAAAARPSLYHGTGRRKVGNNEREELRDGTRRGFGSTAGMHSMDYRSRDPLTYLLKTKYIFVSCHTQIVFWTCVLLAL